MKTRLLRAWLRLVGALPLPLLHALGAAIGTLLWWWRGKPRQMVEQHLDRLFPWLPAPTRRRLARRNLREVGKALLESPAIWYGSEARLRRWVDAPEVAAELRRLTGDGGAIILCPHVGSWELAGMFYAVHGGITSLYKPQKGAIDALILAGRQRLGARLVSSDDRATVRILLTALRQGERIGILPDQDPPLGAGEFAPLLGHVAHTPTLAARLATRTGVPVIGCYAQRLSWGRGFRFHVVPLAAGAARDTEALNRFVEQVIYHLPAQYWWVYPRFRRQPPGSPPFYKNL